MREYYRNYYADPQTEAVRDCIVYREKRSVRYVIEAELFDSLKKVDNQLCDMFEMYLDSYADELEILLEEMYLLGACDKAKMLEA